VPSARGPPIDQTTSVAASLGITVNRTGQRGLTQPAVGGLAARSGTASRRPESSPARRRHGVWLTHRPGVSDRFRSARPAQEQDRRRRVWW
jgi:hypothetical protein